MTYVLKVFAAALMVVSAVLAVIAFSDTLDNLGRAGGERMFGALMLAAFACFVIAFLSGGILWVLTDISQRLAPAKTPDGLAAIRENLTARSLAVGRSSLANDPRPTTND